MKELSTLCIKTLITTVEFLIDKIPADEIDDAYAESTRRDLAYYKSILKDMKPIFSDECEVAYSFYLDIVEYLTVGATAVMVSKVAYTDSDAMTYSYDVHKCHQYLGILCK